MCVQVCMHVCVLPELGKMDEKHVRFEEAECFPRKHALSGAPQGSEGLKVGGVDHCQRKESSRKHTHIETCTHVPNTHS